MSVLRPVGSTQKLLVDRAYDSIKHAIQTLQLPPGEPLVESRLAADMEISKTPVREALVRLAQTGLVVGTPYKGYYVATLTLADAESILSIRSVLEGLAARMACERMSPQDIGPLHELVATARAEAARGEWEKAAEIGHAVHTWIHQHCGDERLQGMIQVLNDQFDRVRLLSAQVPGRLPHSLDEHAEIVEALRAGDEALSEQLMRKHLIAVLDDVRRSEAFLTATAQPAANS